ncbi:uncharacterized protein LOC129404869 [Sorex araneus]|uniref:uncharacterized protein LOC129404869 n=1 Tax=Sorex araneus TaxID=42254 RepID=UPI00243340A1|nr:uncharacterized protein LOC129404869 [Sorex araneus]
MPSCPPWALCPCQCVTFTHRSCSPGSLGARYHYSLAELQQIQTIRDLQSNPLDAYKNDPHRDHLLCISPSCRVYRNKAIPSPPDRSAPSGSPPPSTLPTTRPGTAAPVAHPGKPACAPLQCTVPSARPGRPAVAPHSAGVDTEKEPGVSQGRRQQGRGGEPVTSMAMAAETSQTMAPPVGALHAPRLPSPCHSEARPINCEQHPEPQTLSQSPQAVDTQHTQSGHRRRLFLNFR